MYAKPCVHNARTVFARIVIRTVFRAYMFKAREKGLAGSSWCESRNRGAHRSKRDREKTAATLGTPFNLNGVSHVLVLSDRKMRGRRVQVLVDKFKEILERGDRARKAENG